MAQRWSVRDAQDAQAAMPWLDTPGPAETEAQAPQWGGPPSQAPQWGTGSGQGGMVGVPAANWTGSGQTGYWHGGRGSGGGSAPGGG